MPSCLGSSSRHTDEDHDLITKKKKKGDKMCWDCINSEDSYTKLKPTKKKKKKKRKVNFLRRAPSSHM